MKKQWYNAYVNSFAPLYENDKVYLDCVADLLATPEVQSLSENVQHYDIDRLEHVRSVSYVSYSFCRRRGYDYRLAARAGLLHDLYYYDWHDGDWSHRPHGFRHPGFALKNARELCGPLDKKFENIIHSHMWPLTFDFPRSREAIAVTLADKYCVWLETRRHNAEKIRARFKKSGREE